MLYRIANDPFQVGGIRVADEVFTKSINVQCNNAQASTNYGVLRKDTRISILKCCIIAARKLISS